MPDVGHRQGEVFGKGPGPVDADAAGVVAQVAASRQAVAAAAADDVSFAGDDLAGRKVVDVGADRDDLARQTRGRRPSAPGIVFCAQASQL